MLINIHTLRPQKDDEWSIQNLNKDFDKTDALQYYSMGISPGNINPEFIKSSFDSLKAFSKNKHVLAIGTCGIDRRFNIPVRLQESVFIDQVRWANEIAKPLLISCTNNYREVLSVLKEQHNVMPVVFLDFNDREDVAHMLIENGYYLSFGKSLFIPQTEKVFSKISAEKIFLETGDSELTIDGVFRQAAKIKNSLSDHLGFQIQKNAEKLFNRQLS